MDQQDWVKGKQEDSTMFIVEVAIKEFSGERGLQSYHRLQDKTDEDLASQLMTQGNEQIIQGLLQEALKREAFFDLLIVLTDKDSDLRERFLLLSEVEKEALLQKHEDMLKKMILRYTEELARPIVEEIFLMIEGQIKDKK